MKRGIVLEVRGRMAIVLTPDGQFLRVPVAGEGWWPGQEVVWGERAGAKQGYVGESLRPAGLAGCPPCAPAAGLRVDAREWTGAEKSRTPGSGRSVAYSRPHKVAVGND
ncbi:MAG TPA: anti-sigma factor domain-containing protein [Firmicutes bacterium]|nr:anti-sigma factor domain-containing protein [Bacillota bacterium]